MLRSAQHDIGTQWASRGHTERSEVSHTTSTVGYLAKHYSSAIHSSYARRTASLSTNGRYRSRAR